MTCARSLTCNLRPNIDPLGGQGIDLLQQGGRMDHHAISHDAIDTRPKDARRDQRELVSNALNDDRVTGVGPPLIADDHIVLVAQQINDLTLGLVTPLKPHHTRRTHGAFSPVAQATEPVTWCGKVIQ